VRSGELVALATASARRLPQLPEVPTVAEAGGPVLKDFEASSWFGLLAPAGTPADTVTRLHQETVRTLALPAMKERLLGLGAMPSGIGLADFARTIDAETRKWAKVVAVSGAKVD
jgi:tripartite-type tricarboxylate transporter receptor subunit TctC